MKSETDKKRKKYFSEKPGGYIVAAAVGFIILFWVGLVLAPLALFIINKIFKAIFSKKYSSFKWFLWFLVGIFFLPLHPVNYMTQGEAYSSAVKNGLVNGIKECIVRDANNQTTNFADAQSFKAKYIIYEIKQSLDPDLKNTCFGARAEPNSTYWEIDWFAYNPIKTFDTTNRTWFEINLDPMTGKATKTCGDSSKIGCNEGDRPW